MFWIFLKEMAGSYVMIIIKNRTAKFLVGVATGQKGTYLAYINRVTMKYNSKGYDRH